MHNARVCVFRYGFVNIFNVDEKYRSERLKRGSKRFFFLLFIRLYFFVHSSSYIFVSGLLLLVFQQSVLWLYEHVRTLSSNSICKHWLRHTHTFYIFIHLRRTELSTTFEIMLSRWTLSLFPFLSAYTHSVSFRECMYSLHYYLVAWSI